jgi:hypothetical protein
MALAVVFIGLGIQDIWAQDVRGSLNRRGIPRRLITMSNHNVMLGVGGFNFNGSARYAFEWATADNFTVVMGACLRGDVTSTGIEQPVFPDDNVLRLSGVLSVEPRLYDNFDKRDRLGKNTMLNSANYVSVEAAWVTPAIYHKEYYAGSGFFTVSPRWGLRRVYHGSFAMEFFAGVTALISSGDVRWGPDLGLRVGFVF